MNYCKICTFLGKVIVVINSGRHLIVLREIIQTFNSFSVKHDLLNFRLCYISVSIGLIWDSDRPSLDYIKDVVRCIGTSIRLPDVSNTIIYGDLYSFNRRCVVTLQHFNPTDKQKVTLSWSKKENYICIYFRLTVANKNLTLVHLATTFQMMK